MPTGPKSPSDSAEREAKSLAAQSRAQLADAGVCPEFLARIEDMPDNQKTGLGIKANDIVYPIKKIYGYEVTVQLKIDILAIGPDKHYKTAAGEAKINAAAPNFSNELLGHLQTARAPYAAFFENRDVQQHFGLPQPDKLMCIVDNDYVGEFRIRNGHVFLSVEIPGGNIETDLGVPLYITGHSLQQEVDKCRKKGKELKDRIFRNISLAHHLVIMGNKIEYTYADDPAVKIVMHFMDPGKDHPDYFYLTIGEGDEIQYTDNFFINSAIDNDVESAIRAKLASATVVRREVHADLAGALGANEKQAASAVTPTAAAAEPRGAVGQRPAAAESAVPVNTPPTREPGVRVPSPEEAPALPEAYTSITPPHDGIDEIATNPLDKPKIVHGLYGKMAFGADAGGRPEHNEDRVVVNTADNSFASIDGMGGMGNGEKAAVIFAEEMQKGFNEKIHVEEIQQRAHARMAAEGVGQGGVCYISAHIEGRTLEVCQAGDVRLIVLDENGKLVFETRDQNSPLPGQGHVVTNAVTGLSSGATVRSKFQLKKGYRIVAASDGLFDNVGSRDLSGSLEVASLIKGKSIEEAMRRLNDHARERMQNEKRHKRHGVAAKADNINVIVYDIEYFPRYMPIAPDTNGQYAVFGRYVSNAVGQHVYVDQERTPEGDRMFYYKTTDGKMYEIAEVDDSRQYIIKLRDFSVTCAAEYGKETERKFLEFLGANHATLSREIADATRRLEMYNKLMANASIKEDLKPMRKNADPSSWRWVSYEPADGHFPVHIKEHGCELMRTHYGELEDEVVCAFDPATVTAEQLSDAIRRFRVESKFEAAPYLTDEFKKHLMVDTWNREGSYKTTDGATFPIAHHGTNERQLNFGVSPYRYVYGLEAEHVGDVVFDMPLSVKDANDASDPDQLDIIRELRGIYKYYETYEILRRNNAIDERLKTLRKRRIKPNIPCGYRVDGKIFSKTYPIEVAGDGTFCVMVKGMPTVSFSAAEAKAEEIDAEIANTLPLVTSPAMKAFRVRMDAVLAGVKVLWGALTARVSKHVQRKELPQAGQLAALPPHEAEKIEHLKELAAMVAELSPEYKARIIPSSVSVDGVPDGYTFRSRENAYEVAHIKSLDSGKRFSSEYGKYYDEHRIFLRIPVAVGGYSATARVKICDSNDFGIDKSDEELEGNKRIVEEDLQSFLEFKEQHPEFASAVSIIPRMEDPSIKNPLDDDAWSGSWYDGFGFEYKNEKIPFNFPHGLNSVVFYLDNMQIGFSLANLSKAEVEKTIERVKTVSVPNRERIVGINPEGRYRLRFSQEAPSGLAYGYWPYDGVSEHRLLPIQTIDEAQKTITLLVGSPLKPLAINLAQDSYKIYEDIKKALEEAAAAEPTPASREEPPSKHVPDAEPLAQLPARLPGEFSAAEHAYFIRTLPEKQLAALYVLKARHLHAEAPETTTDPDLAPVQIPLAPPSAPPIAATGTPAVPSSWSAPSVPGYISTHAAPEVPELWPASAEPKVAPSDAAAEAAAVPRPAPAAAPTEAPVNIEDIKELAKMIAKLPPDYRARITPRAVMANGVPSGYNFSSQGDVWNVHHIRTSSYTPGSHNIDLNIPIEVEDATITTRRVLFDTTPIGNTDIELVSVKANARESLTAFLKLKKNPEFAALVDIERMGYRSDGFSFEYGTVKFPFNFSNDSICFSPIGGGISVSLPRENLNKREVEKALEKAITISAPNLERIRKINRGLQFSLHFSMSAREGLEYEVFTEERCPVDSIDEEKKTFTLLVGPHAEPIEVSLEKDRNEINADVRKALAEAAPTPHTTSTYFGDPSDAEDLFPPGITPLPAPIRAQLKSEGFEGAVMERFVHANNVPLKLRYMATDGNDYAVLRLADNTFVLRIGDKNTKKLPIGTTSVNDIERAIEEANNLLPAAAPVVSEGDLFSAVPGISVPASTRPHVDAQQADTDPDIKPVQAPVPAWEQELASGRGQEEERWSAPWLKKRPEEPLQSRARLPVDAREAPTDRDLPAVPLPPPPPLPPRIPTPAPSSPAVPVRLDESPPRAWESPVYRPEPAPRAPRPPAPMRPTAVSTGTPNPTPPPAGPATPPRAPKKKWAKGLLAAAALATAGGAAYKLFDKKTPEPTEATQTVESREDAGKYTTVIKVTRNGKSIEIYAALRGVKKSPGNPKLHVTSHTKTQCTGYVQIDGTTIQTDYFTVDLPAGNGEIVLPDLAYYRYKK